jgi:hypothetical protein
MTIASLAAADRKGPQNAGRFCLRAKKDAVLQALSAYGESSCDLRKTALRHGAAFAFMAAPPTTDEQLQEGGGQDGEGS